MEGNVKTQWTPHSWRATITCKLEEMFIVFKSVSMGRGGRREGGGELLIM